MPRSAPRCLDGRLRHARVGIARRAFEPDLLSAGLALRDRVGPSRSSPRLLRCVRDAGRPCADGWQASVAGQSFLLAAVPPRRWWPVSLARFVGGSVGLAPRASGLCRECRWREHRPCAGAEFRSPDMPGRPHADLGSRRVPRPPATRHPARRLVRVAYCACSRSPGASRCWPAASTRTSRSSSTASSACRFLRSRGYVAVRTSRPDTACGGHVRAPLGVHAIWRPFGTRIGTRSPLMRSTNPSYLLAAGSLHEQRERARSTVSAGEHGAHRRRCRFGIHRPGVAANAARSRPPHVFLFLVDSLRSDYLSPYNASVHHADDRGVAAATRLSEPRSPGTAEPVFGARHLGPVQCSRTSGPSCRSTG